MKEKEYNPKDSFIGYVNSLKEKLDRELSNEEYSKAMKAYISAKTPEECAKALGEK